MAESNPTAAAIRAAKKISTLTSSTDPEWSDLYSIEQVALIIDRETALPEMVEAVTKSRKSIMDIRDIIEDVGRGEEDALEAAMTACDALFDALHAALAKVEGK